ncbi:MAG: indole-3-glycerol-phosphate synthase [Gemmatimonadales bacterium]
MPNSKDIRTGPEAQGESQWGPPSGTLGQLIAQAWERSQALSSSVLEAIAPPLAGSVPSLRAALGKDKVAVIAEVKRSSPSRGSINPGIDAAEQARSYAAGGAAAISVLTESNRFGGSNEDLSLVRTATSLPILRKDFHVSELQLSEAARLGASGALLIVRAIQPSRLRALAQAGRDLGLDLVFEVRDMFELSRALAAGAEIIGVNNRNLETLRMDPTTVGRIVPLIPRECVAIAESGYANRDDIESAALAGADAVLVGSSLSGSLDPMEAVRSITGVPKRLRDS